MTMALNSVEICSVLNPYDARYIMRKHTITMFRRYNYIHKHLEIFQPLMI